jgi:hypothetical protein
MTTSYNSPIPDPSNVSQAFKSGVKAFHPHIASQPFDPLTQLARFEQEFPAQMKLFRFVGIHPTETVHPMNPYTKEISSESFSNIGEHCIAVAHCASVIAHALVVRGILTEDDARLITERALVHDLNKPFEIMRRNAQKNGFTEDVYSISAYEKLQPLLIETGIEASLSEYLVNAGAETGHNSLRMFIKAGPNGYDGLAQGMIAEKIVHLADDMTFTNHPKEGQSAVTVYMTCDERMIASHFHEKYPFLWSEGLVARQGGEILPVKDLSTIDEGLKVIGSYADLQVKVANAIARELQLLLEPESTEEAKDYICSILHA